MKNKLPISNLVCAILLTVIVLPALIISFFTIPLELIIFEPESYYPILENVEYQEELPQVVSTIITDQFINDERYESPTILENEDSLKSIIKKHLSEEWINEIFVDVINKVTAYLNFKSPYSSIEVNIVDLKNELLLNSSILSDEYLLSLDNCTVEEDSMLDGKEIIDLSKVPFCKPSTKNRNIVSSALSMMIEDKVNQLPATINLVGVIPVGMILGEKSFYYYTITRWIFRLLPFITLATLIFIAYLLRKNKKIMRKWSGLVLTVISAFTLLSLLVLLIGFDQFTGLIFKRYFSQVIAGFGNVLLGMIQHVGNQVLQWVIVISGFFLFLGLILLLSVRFTKVEVEETNKNLEVLASDKKPKSQKKDVIPETIEEIEKQERKLDKEEKKNSGT